MSRENDACLLLEKRLSGVEQRQDLVEHRQQRFMKLWIASNLTSSTSGPIAPTSPTSTDTTTKEPTASPPIIRHGLRYLPKIAGWLAERFLAVILPWLLPFLGGLWALGWERLQALWAYVVHSWRWLFV